MKDILTDREAIQNNLDATIQKIKGAKIDPYDQLVLIAELQRYKKLVNTAFKFGEPEDDLLKNYLPIQDNPVVQQYPPIQLKNLKNPE